MAAAVNEAVEPAVAEARRGGFIPTPWTVEDYAYTANSERSAAKLADSAVAPLVAMARGYETVTEDTLNDAYKRFALPARNSTQGRRLTEAIRRGDVLVMPWFTHDDLALDRAAGRAPRPATIQYRPARPARNDKGQEIKYEFAGGHGTPMGTHPAFPVEWFDQTPIVLIAEGLLKGDSALTAYLLHHGIDRANLGWSASDGSGDEGRRLARARLNTLLMTIPLHERMLILTIAGVDNWRNNSEWRSLDLRDRETWIGIDGDVASNPHVHRAASQLWEYVEEKKHSTLHLLAPVVDPGPNAKKVGIDDYLAKYGSWARLLSENLSSELPLEPEGHNLDSVGSYRMSPDGTGLEFCRGIMDSHVEDRYVRGVWEPVAGMNIGGRVLALVAQRTPSKEEIETGVFGAGADSSSAPWTVEVEISWADRFAPDTIHRYVVSGPSAILNYTADQWDRHRAHIPGPVLKHSAWPPERKYAEHWLRALKEAREVDTQERVQWGRMGWVPVDGSVPAFIAGDQVIGVEESAHVDVLPGVGEAELSGASRFGLGADDHRGFADATYRDQVRADIEETLSTIVNLGAWTDRRVASTMVATALRPALPVRPQTICYFVGPPRKGKALPLTALVPVPVSQRFPTGWACNGDLVRGDEVYAPDGTITQVVHHSPVIDDMDLFEFVTADGRRTVSTAGHLWKISTKYSRSTRRSQRAAADRDANPALAKELRDLASRQSNDVGVAVGELAKLAHLLPRAAEVALEEAGVPSEDLTQTNAVGRHAATLRLYPVGEALHALANHVEAPGVSPVEIVMTAADVAALPANALPAIRVPGAVHGPAADLPIDPYLLGVWLGTHRAHTITDAIGHLDAAVVAQLEARGIGVVPIAGRHHRQGLGAALAALGVTSSKHIAVPYLRASAQQRLHLLQGLMDASGSISRVGQSEFTTTNHELADNVLELVRSLGIRATCTLRGERRRIRFTTTLPTVTIPAKAARCPNALRVGEWTQIVEINPLPATPSSCIQVAHPTGMYLAYDFVPTHNSWSAAVVMSFWSRRGGDFTASSLPGSAKDTPASMEMAVSLAPIWVVDDLAPASSRQQSEAEQGKIADLVRNIFNGAAKRRSTVDMAARRVHTPNALLVVTAENELQIASARDRCVTLPIGYGALGADPRSTTDLVNDLCFSPDRGAPARVTQALIRYLRHLAATHPGGWPAFYRALLTDADHAQERAKVHMETTGSRSGDNKRHATMAGDLNVALMYLERLAREVGCSDDILELLATNQMQADVVDLVAEGHRENNEITPGRALIEAIAGALTRKSAHILDARSPSTPPGGGDEYLASALGWELNSSTEARPRGETIGYYLDRDTGPVIFFDQKAAFALAQREYPNLVPHGQSSRNSWNSVIGENLHVPDLLRVGANGRPLTTGRQRVPGTNQMVSGTPVALTMLLAQGDATLTGDTAT